MSMSSMTRASVAALALLLATPATAGLRWEGEPRDLTCAQMTEQIEWLRGLQVRLALEARARGCRLGDAQCLASSAIFRAASQARQWMERVRLQECVEA